MTTEPRQRAERLTGDTLTAFLALCQSDLTAAQIIDRMYSEHGTIVDANRVYKARERLEYKKGKHKPRGAYGSGSRVQHTPPLGKCVRCKSAPATHPGVPVGLNGRVCLPCQRDVIDGRAEERWEAKQAEIKRQRALREALAMFPNCA